MQRTLKIINHRSDPIDYEIKEDRLSPIDANPTIASGHLAANGSESKSIQTDDENDDYHIAYRIRLPRENWRGWDGSWVHDKQVELT